MGCCASAEERPRAHGAAPRKPTQEVRFDHGRSNAAYNNCHGNGNADNLSPHSGKAPPSKTASVMSCPVAQASTGVMCMRKEQADRELKRQRQLEAEKAERERGFLARVQNALGDAGAEKPRAAKTTARPRNDIEVCSNHSESSEGWDES